MTLERLQKRWDKLISVVQQEIKFEQQLNNVTDPGLRGQILINLQGARQERDELLRKWSLYPSP